MKFNAFVYNVSWASQIGVEAGSEADFVRACKKRDKCFSRAVELVNALDSETPLDVAAFHEVNTDDFENKFTLQRLNARRRGMVTGAQGQCVQCSLMWSTRKFGKEEWHCAFDLDVGRPCLLVVTSRGFLFVVAHFPWVNRRRKIDQLSDSISSRAPFHLFHISHVVVLADANDAKTLLHIERPLLIQKRKVSPQRSKEWLREHLLTCCWHEKGHQWGSMDSTGDYIMVDKSLRIVDVGVPISFLTSEAEGSDHRPVMAIVETR